MIACLEKHSEPATAAIIRTPAAGGDAIAVRVAGTLDEYETAFRIAYDVYHALGFTEYSPVGLRIAPAQFDPSSLVLLAFHDGQAVATLSLYADGPGGIPSESGWPTEIGRQRAAGWQFFELGSLMALPQFAHLGKRICLELFRTAWLHIRRVAQADGMCAFVQTRHAPFYKRLMGFRDFGPPRTYRWNGLSFPEVVPLFMDLTDAETDFRSRYERWGQDPRNLYRFFVEEAPWHLELLRLGLSRREALDFDELADRFAPFLPPTLKAKAMAAAWRNESPRKEAFHGVGAL